jgi:dephospho-CoA kinase
VLLVGLTGNIASGKSLVTRGFAARGATVIDADALAREAVEPGTPALEAISARWGPAVLRDDGSIDRAALRRIVFADPSERAALNAIVHPAVEARRKSLIERARAAGARIVVCDIPLLFEVGLERGFDVVVLVDAPEAVRLDRLARYRSLTDAEARNMLDAQMSASLKRGRAHYVIDNASTREALDREVERVWQALATHPSSVS